MSISRPTHFLINNLEKRWTQNKYRYDDLTKPFRFENVPKTYRFKSSYSREEPPGTYQRQMHPEKQKVQEKEKNVPSDSIGMVSTHLNIQWIIDFLSMWSIHVRCQKLIDKSHTAVLEHQCSPLYISPSLTKKPKHIFFLQIFCNFSITPF